MGKLTCHRLYVFSNILLCWFRYWYYNVPDAAYSRMCGWMRKSGMTMERCDRKEKFMCERKPGTVAHFVYVLFDLIDLSTSNFCRHHSEFYRHRSSVHDKCSLQNRLSHVLIFIHPETMVQCYINLTSTDTEHMRTSQVKDRDVHIRLDQAFHAAQAPKFVVALDTIVQTSIEVIIGTRHYCTDQHRNVHWHWTRLYRPA